MTVKTALKSAAPTPKVAAQTTVGVITGLITWLLVTTYWKTGLPVQVAVALPGLVTWGVGFAAGWLKQENIVIPPLDVKDDALSPHTAGWLADVRKPGPNGVVFWKPGEDVGAPYFATSSNLMEDDVTASEFTPGCYAYAGYSAGNFANMTAVRAYAAGQGAKSFAFSGIASDLVGANAIDMEPGLASTSDAAGAYRQGIRYFYASASSVAAVNANLTAAGIARSSYKIISAHYSGEHICGPSTCGYPQADATQFTDNYLGRSLDCTVFDSTFWGTTPVPPPNPNPVLQLGSTGTAVVLAQTDLNKWKVSPAVAEDGNFGALTEAAVKQFQGVRNLTVDGVVGPSTWAVLKSTPPAPPVSWNYLAPANLRVDVAGHTSVSLTWSQPLLQGHPKPDHYVVWIYKGRDLVATYPRNSTELSFEGGGLAKSTAYVAHVGTSGVGTAHLGTDVFASTSFTTGA